MCQLRAFIIIAGIGSLLAACSDVPNEPTQSTTPATTTEGADETAALTTTATLAFKQLSPGQFHTCGVTTDNRAFCWGSNQEGQLGTGNNTFSRTPVAVVGGHSFREVSSGSQHSCGVTTDDRAFCWGYNAAGQLGDGTQSNCGHPNPPCTSPETIADKNRPVAVRGGLRFRQVDAGMFYTCGVATDNRAYCWGNNRWGQLGDGAAGSIARALNRPTPVAVAGGLSFERVSAGPEHTCGVTTGNRAFCWGNNRGGQLGDGSTVRQRLVPSPVAGGRPFRQVSAGGSQATSGFTCGTTTIDKAFCWGDGTLGQIGDGTTIPRWTPRAVAGGHSFRQVSAGRESSCARTPENVAYCWGLNGVGEVGDGTMTQRLKPVLVAGGHRFSQLSGEGVLHTCGRTPTFTAYCWGNNSTGQLGDGTGIDRTRPRPVAGTT